MQIQNLEETLTSYIYMYNSVLYFADRHNIHKTAMHLTNFSVNKTSAQYVHNDDLLEVCTYM